MDLVHKSLGVSYLVAFIWVRWYVTQLVDLTHLERRQVTRYISRERGEKKKKTYSV